MGQTAENQGEEVTSVGDESATIDASAPVSSEEQPPIEGTVPSAEVKPTEEDVLKAAEILPAKKGDLFSKPSELPKPEGTKNPSVEESSKTVEVDNIEVEFLHSITFMHGPKYYQYRGGEKAKVSKALYRILYERGCIKSVVI